MILHQPRSWLSANQHAACSLCSSIIQHCSAVIFLSCFFPFTCFICSPETVVGRCQLVKLNEFKMEMGEFSDVCSCACPSASCFQVHCKAKNCDGFHLACKCDVKVPKREIQLLLDQRCAQKNNNC